MHTDEHRSSVAHSPSSEGQPSSPRSDGSTTLAAGEATKLRFTAADYDRAIGFLYAGRNQLEPDGRDCAICGDSGHQAWECHHNPLTCLIDAATARTQWRCFHCDEVFRSEAAAKAHFGPREPQRDPACRAHADQLHNLKLDLGKEFTSRFPEAGIMAIAAERARQVRKGYTLARDDQQDCDELIECAELIVSGIVDGVDDIGSREGDPWPLQRADHVLTKYADDRVKQLAIAGALIAAEIDRLSRSQSINNHQSTAIPAEPTQPIEQDTFNH